MDHNLPLLNSKRMTSDAFAYIVNNVIIPQFLYRCKDYMPLISVMEQIDARLRAIWRRKMRPVRGTPSVLIHSHDIGGVNELAPRLAR